MTADAAVVDTDRPASPDETAAFKAATTDTTPTDEAAPSWGPIMLPGLEPLPDLPASLLPTWVGEMVDAVARSTQTAPAAGVMLSLSVVAAVVQRRFEVAPFGDDHRETLSLWTLVALPSGSRKTAVMAPLLKPLFDWEKRQGDAMRSSIAKVQATRGVAKRRIERLENEAAKADSAEQRKEKQDELAQVIEETPKEVFAPRLVTGDTTAERLQGLLVEQRERISLFSDESGIFIVLAGLYSGGQIHIDSFLQAHSGAFIRVDRAGRMAHIDRPALSFGLALQPKVLQEVAEVPRFRHTGFLARFLFALPESTVGKRDLRLRVAVPEAITRAYEAGLGALLEGAGDPAAPPRILALTPAASESWLDFAQAIEHEVGPGQRLEPIDDWAGKLPGQAVRVAGLMQLAWKGLQTEAIELEMMRQAIELCTRLIPHALAAFRLLGTDEKEADALFLLRWVRLGRLTAFDRSHAHKALESRFRTVDRLKTAAARLAEWNVLSEERRRANRSARATPYYAVNPQLFAESTDSQRSE